MAQRRMFSLKVVDTDEFLDMPMSSQYLYFNLGMRADDDGFISNPKKILRMVNCSDDDIKVLVSKNFVIPFDSGVCVIKHWKTHNLIRSDRYTETEYKEEKKTLALKDNKYVIPDVIPKHNQMEPQGRLGKVRIGKVKLLPAKADEEFNFNSFFKGMNDHKRRDFQIMALYWKIKKIKFSNKAQAYDEIKRLVKPASVLKPYEDEKIFKTMDYLENYADFKWGLETVRKFINEDLDKLKQKSK